MAAADPKRGEVWLANTPGEASDQHHPRFVLVVSADALNRHRDHVMVVPSSQPAISDPPAWLYRRMEQAFATTASFSARN